MRGDTTREKARATHVRADRRSVHEHDGLLPHPASLQPLTKAWLDDHVPLTLIMDLSMPFGPHSRELLAAEPAPETAWWVRPGGPRD